jgi:tetratricopeptide (TPR) repeat protein
LPAGLAYAKSGNTAKADLYLGKAEAAGIDTSDAKFVQIDALESQKKYPEALAALDKIIRAEPQNGEAYYRRASIYDDMDQTDKAIEAYKEAARISPANSLPWFDLGTIYYNKGDYNNSEKAYLEAIKIDPTSAQAHANLASVYRQKEKFPEANAEYKKAEELGMKTPDLYSEWGYCLGQTKEWDKSTARLETARSISPTAVDDNNAGWGYYNAAQADKQAKNDAAAKQKLEKSKTSFTSATQKDPKLDAAYVNLGSTHNSLGEYDQAVAALNQANQLHSDWVVALNLLGVADRGQNNLTMALQVLNRSVNLDGNNIVGLFNLGSTQNAAGDKKGAKKTQDRLKKISPELANQLGGIIAGKIIEAGTNEIKKKIFKIPF